MKTSPVLALCLTGTFMLVSANDAFIEVDGGLTFGVEVPGGFISGKDPEVKFRNVTHAACFSCGDIDPSTGVPIATSCTAWPSISCSGSPSVTFGTSEVTFPPGLSGNVLCWTCN
ncbi:hypothetical protein F5884DRAFT_810298 [Xylogone sp. PMI_703]|nr:hypothetical protein F5884DRAFT_810298 [Xylogone sp. PMI_703]